MQLKSLMAKFCALLIKTDLIDWKKLKTFFQKRLAFFEKV